MKTTFPLKTLAVAGALFLATTVAASALSWPAPSASQGTYAGCVRVTWPASAYGRKGYYVYRTPTARFVNAVRLGRTSSSSRVWIDRRAGAARKYYYWVCPVGYKLTAGQSAHAQQGGWRFFAVPKAAVTMGTTGVALRWNASRQAVYGYRIFRGTTASTSSAVTLGNTYGRVFVDRTAYPGRTYYYWIGVRGYNVVVRAPAKRTAAWRKLVVPAPDGYWSGDDWNSPFYFYWSSSYGAQQYQIYRGTSWSAATLWATTTRTSLYDYDVPHDGQNYYYWICPVDIEGDLWYNTDNWVRARNSY